MDRGVRLDRTYQLNFGGNTDFLNMLERERLESKKISKTNAVTSMLDYEMDPDDVHVGPSDHVPWLLDRKWCYIRMEGTTYGDVPLNAELKLEVWDSPNSAGVITDAIRCLKLGLDRGLKGTLVAPSSYFMKSPPVQIHDDIAYNRVEAFIRGEDNETLVGTEKPDEGPAPEARLHRRQPRPRPQRRRPHRGDDAASPASRRRIAARSRVRESSRSSRSPATRPRRGSSAHVPGRLARWVIGTGSQAGYLVWPAKRQLVERELRPRPGAAARRSARPPARAPGLPRVRDATSSRLMHLPRRRTARPRAARVIQADLDHIETVWKDSPGGADLRRRPRRQQRGDRGRASRIAGWPINVVADDSSFPEMFERFRRRARGVGRPRHPVAQPARDLQDPPAPRDARACSSTGATAPTASRSACSGRGRRCRRVPRRSPRRPARRSCRSRSGGRPTARFHVSYAPVVTVASTAPADLQRATQAIADALERDRRRRARPVVQLQADVAPDPGRGRGARGAGRRDARRRRVRAGSPGSAVSRRVARRRRSPRPGRCRGRRARRRPPPEDRGGVTAAEARRPRGTPGQRLRARGLTTASWLACHLPEAPLVAIAEWLGDAVVPPRARASRPGPAQPPPRRPLPRRQRPRRRPDARRGHRPARAREPRPVRVPPARPLLPRGRCGRRRLDSGELERPDRRREPRRSSTPRSPARRPVDLRRPPLRRRSSCPACYLADRSGGRPVVAPMETLGDPALQALVRADPRRARRPDRDAPRGAPRARGRAASGASTSGSSATATSPAAASKCRSSARRRRSRSGPALLAIEAGAPIYLAGSGGPAG